MADAEGVNTNCDEIIRTRRNTEWARAHDNMLTNYQKWRKHGSVKAALLLFLAVLPLWSAETIVVSAGDHDRRNTVITFRAGTNDRALRAGNKTFPLQVNEDGTASFVVDELSKGKELRLRLEAVSGPKASSGSSPAEAGTPYLEARWDKAKVKIGPSPEPWLEYQGTPSALPRPNIKQLFQRGAYLHPIRTLSGKVITDDYPLDHVHHHGVWWAWTKTEFDGRTPDFWNMGGGTARVDFVAMEKTWEGPVHAGFVAKHRFVDLSAPTPAGVLNEKWEVRIYNNGGNGIWIFDLTSTQECATDKPLKLPEYHYGGLGFRGHWDWNGKTNVDFLTSEGITDRVKGHGTRARWCDISGLVGGSRAGITIMCHPENFRAPQPMRLHPSEPFFCYTPQQGGDMEITPGKPYVSRYRFVVHDGPPDKDVIERLWNDYAHPPVVKVN